MGMHLMLATSQLFPCNKWLKWAPRSYNKFSSHPLSPRSLPPFNSNHVIGFLLDKCPHVFLISIWALAGQVSVFPYQFRSIGSGHATCVFTTNFSTVDHGRVFANTVTRSSRVPDIHFGWHTNCSSSRSAGHYRQFDLSRSCHSSIAIHQVSPAFVHPAPVATAPSSSSVIASHRKCGR